MDNMSKEVKMSRSKIRKRKKERQFVSRKELDLKA